MGGPHENDEELEKFQVIVVGYVDVAAQGGDPIVTFGEGFRRCVESHALRSMKAHLFSEYFEQQDIQAVGLIHALDVAPLRNELEDVEATHQVQNLAANESTGTLREV